MNNPMLAEMLEATRLTQAGRLNEATAMIQRALRGQHTATPVADAEPRSAAREPIEGSFRVVGREAPAPTRGAPKPVPSPFARFAQAAPQWQNFELPGLQPQRRPASPADIVPAGGRFLDGSYTNQAGTRSYKLYIPSSYHGQAMPLVLMLHGCTQDPDDFAAGTQMNQLAEEQGWLVLYPAQARSANLQKCWNWFNASDQQREQGEPSLLVGMTRQIARDYNVDPRRIYAAGLSSGGAMAAILGATHPDLFAAVGIHSGLAAGAARDLPSAFAAMRQGGHGGNGTGAYSVPTIVFHGDRDTTVHPRNGELVIEQATVAGARADKLRVSSQRGEVAGGRSYTRAVYRDANGQDVMEHWLIHGAGHAWAGGSPGGSYTDPKGPSASREMLRFFSAHALRQASAATH